MSDTEDNEIAQSAEADAYCPSCEVELEPHEYDDSEGHEACGTEDLWLSPSAFLRVTSQWGIIEDTMEGN